MPLITLEEAKQQCRVDGDHEDALMQTMVTAAIAYITQACNRTDLEGNAMAKSAALLVVADLYANREAQNDGPLSQNRTLDTLINMARDYKGYVQ